MDFSTAYRKMLDDIVNGASLDAQTSSTAACVAAMSPDTAHRVGLFLGDEAPSPEDRNARTVERRFGDVTPAERNERLIGRRSGR